MLPLIDEIDENANTGCHVSADEEEKESSCSDLNPDDPTNNDDLSTGNRDASTTDPTLKKEAT